MHRTEERTAIPASWCLGPEDSSPPWPGLAPGGEELVLAKARDRWVFLLVLDLSSAASGPVRSQVVLPTPEPMGQVMVTVSGDSVWLVGMHGGLLQLARGSWEVVGWNSLRELMVPGTIMEDASIVPGGQYIWCTADIPDSRSMTWDAVVIDLERMEVHATIPEVDWVRPVFGTDPSRVACFNWSDRDVRLFGADGSPIAGRTAASQILDVALHPDGERLIGLVRGENEVEEPDQVGLHVAVLSSERTQTDMWSIHGAIHWDGASIASSSAWGLTIVQFFDPEERAHLLALRPQGDGFQEVWRVSTPRPLALLQDEESGHVVAVWDTGDRLMTSELGPATPAFPSRIPYPGLPHYGPDAMCSEPPGELGEMIEGMQARFTLEDREEPLKKMAAHWKAHQDDPDEIAALVNGTRGVWDPELGKVMAARSIERHPGHPGLSLYLAESAASRQEWETVYGLLDGVTTEGLDDVRAQHIHHLFGIALLHRGEPERAISVWVEGLQYEGGFCRLDHWLELASRPSGSAGPGRAGGNGGFHRLLELIETTDRHLQREEWEEARRTIDHPLVWRLREVQSTARLALAHLHSSPAGGAPWIRKALALATLIALRQHPKVLSPPNLVIPVIFHGHAPT